MSDSSEFLRLVEPNSGAPVDGAPLGALITAQALLAPRRPALTFGEITLDRDALDRRSNRRARQLQSLGVKADDMVIIALPNSIEYYETTLAIWKIGAAPCPLSPLLSSREFGELLALAEPVLVIGPDPAACGKWPCLPAKTPPDPALSDAPMPIVVGKVARIASSGGSTGRPKLVIDPSPAIWGPEKSTIRRLPGSTIVNPGPLYHSGPFMLIQTALCEGSHVIDMGGKFDAGRWLELVEQYQADWAYLVPTMMARIAKLPAAQTSRADLSSLHTVVHMAAPCPEWVKAWWIDRLYPDAIWEVYGGTERIGSTIIGGEAWLTHRGSVGRPRASFSVEILGEEGQSLPPGEIGEIFFRKLAGPSETYAYIGAEGRRRGDLDGFGDLGYLDEDGYLYIADRRTDMIVSGGINFYPAEIEAAIERLPGVVAAAVIGLPHVDLGQVLHAVVQVNPEHAGLMDAEQLIVDLAPSLSRQKLPRSIEITTERLRDEAGKMRRSALRDARLTPPSK